jgi:cytochrome c
MRRATPAACALLLCTLGAQSAGANPELARAHHCMNCHQLDHKRVGPGFREIAARYANDPGAEVRLSEKIRLGGAGAWSAVPMPANDVTQDEARTLARWILGLK